MASISNLVGKYAPTAAKVGGTIVPSLAGPLKLGANYLTKKTAAPVAGAVLPPKVEAAVTPSQTSSSYTPSTGTNGLLKANSSDLNALRSQLEGIQSSLASLQTPKTTTTPTFPSLVGQIQTASTPSNTQTGLVNRISDTASGFRPIADEAKRISDEYAKEIARVGGLGAGAVAGALSTGTDVVGSGNAAIASQSASARMSALSDAQQAALRGTEQQLSAQGQTAGTLGNALTGATALQGQQLSGLGSAAGFAQPSGTYPFVFNPLTGQFSDQSGAGGGGSQMTAQQYAQDVISGARTYNDAVAAMGLYGPSGKIVLDQMIQQQNPNFNFAQAQTLSGIQGTVAPDVQFAKEALIALQNSLAGLSGAQTTGFTPLREAANFLSAKTGIGAEATRTTAGYVADARNALQKALSSAHGGTPSDYGDQAMSMLPNQPSAKDVAAAIAVVESLGAIRQGVYGSPGTSGGSSGGSAGWY